MGGGNSLNIIRLPSVNEVKNIIFTTDLNGSITPWDVNVWHWITNYLWWSQNNENDTAYATGSQISNPIAYKNPFLKNTTYNQAWSMIYVFGPIIEYKE